MRAMDLDHLETGLKGAVCRHAEGTNNVLNAHPVQFIGRLAAGIEWDGTRADDRTPSTHRLRDRHSALPRRRRARLASGVRQLDSGGRSVLPDKCRDTGQLLDVIVRVDPEIAWADPAARLHAGSFGKHEPGAAHCAGA